MYVNTPTVETHALLVRHAAVPSFLFLSSLHSDVGGGDDAVRQREYLKQLEEALTLLAFKNAEASPLGHLLEVSNR